MSIKNKSTVLIFALFLTLLIVQVGFYFIQISYEKSLILSIQALVNKESIASNPYLLSQELSNLESLKLLKCSKLKYKKTGRIYIDNSFYSDCETSFLKLNGKSISTNINAINGDVWEIHFISNNSSEFQLLLWIVRFLVCALGISFFKIHQWRIEQKNLEIAKQELEIESANLLSKIASQVSHDIRSPLSALKMALGELGPIPSDQRSMIHNSIQRINDIANNLLRTNKTTPLDQSLILEEELLYLTLDSLISEKRMQYRDHLNLTIELCFKADHRVFAQINQIEFHRVLSNLINNSVEALVDGGTILINVFEVSNETILIEIIDNGKGMPKHVLEKLGERGFSHGKLGIEAGTGLGVFHAKETIESFGGNFRVESTEGVGTKISIDLPKTKNASWFAEEIVIPPNEKIFVLDDDENIFQMWIKKVGGIAKYYSQGKDFSKIISEEKDRNYLCLIDYELTGQELTGLELIELLNISHNSILVTSRYGDKHVRDHCKKLGMKLIPKALVEWIPIRKIENENYIFDYVYIDDDHIFRMGWEKRAKKNNIKLLTIKSTSEFRNYSHRISKETTSIYIDSNLGEGELRGEEFAKILHADGFKKLYIASGYEADNFSHLPWLTYAGKECPF